MCQFCPQRFGRKDHLVRHTKKSHVGSSCSPPNNVRKYEPPTPQPDDNHENNPLSLPPQMSDLPGLVISPTSVPSMMDPPPPPLEPVKPDPTYIPPHTNLVQSNYTLNHMPNENGQGLKMGEPSYLPATQYLPISSSYPAVTPIMPHHYINMSTSGNILSDLLPPMSIASSFSALSLDVNNPPLPHFSQAFQ
ncbi:hypothetical protein CEXT_681101 [Caerostris extrusa]|uniref:C2H2-type domain-containing protein n=1 Tax=Caerostris extrusa TaxID=172846 RepID=A0AAV4WN58_CAEEX|nr:hypothetical protein CEXT_681101 [Caerostris extrusa]